MFAQVAQGKMTPEDAVDAFTKTVQRLYRKWQNQGLV